jgi:hypothetical protein
LGFLEQDAGVVGQVARREIIGAVHHDVVLRQDIQRVFAADAGIVQDHFDVWIDAFNCFLGRFGLGAADVRCAMDDLALEVGKIDRVKINHADFADAGRRQVHGDGRAKTARANADDAGGADFLLSSQADFRQNQVPRVAANLVIIQLHSRSFPQRLREVAHKSRSDACPSSFS